MNYQQCVISTQIFIYLLMMQKIFRHIQTNEDHILLQRSVTELEEWCDNSQAYYK